MQPPRATPAGATRKPSPMVLPAPDPASTAATVPALKKRFRLAWTLQTKPFNQGVALSESLVAALGSGSLALMDMRRGNIVRERDVCTTFAGAFSFVSETLGALVCEGEVQLLSVPGLKVKVRIALPGRARVAAFGKTHAAIAFDAGPVRLYAIDGWSLVREVAVDHEVRSMAVSRDGRRLVIGLDQGDVLLIDREADTMHRVTVKMGLPIETVAFDFAGERWVVSAGPSVAVWDVLQRSQVHRFRSVSDVLAVGWAGQGEIASAGRDGLLVLDIERDVAKSLSGGLDGDEPPVALALSEDGRVLCAAEQDGRLACYARGKIPTRSVPIAGYGADRRRMSGRVVTLGALSPGAQRLTVRAHAHTNIPPPGVDARVLRYTETRVGDVRSARWIELATGRVVKVKDQIVHLRIDGPVNTIADVSDPLTYDTPIRLVWKRIRSPTQSPAQAPAQAPAHAP